MSDAKGAEGKGKGKKKGKLPLILVVVLVVAGGGFFATSKGKAKEEPKKPAIELGAVESLGEEFLLNLGNDGRTFLTCSISVQLRKPDKDNKDDHVSAADPAGDDGSHAAGDASYSVARDAVISVLSSKKVEDFNDPNAMKMLKREIAAALNHVLHHEDPKEEEDPKEKRKKEREAEKNGGHGDAGHGGGHAEIDHEWLDEIGWDSEDGPVLKVLFNDFAYQKY